MSDERTAPEHGGDDGSDMTNISFDLVEEVIDEATEHVTRARESVDGTYSADLDDVDDQVASMKKATEDTEDGDIDALSEVESRIDYAQAVTEAVEDATDDENVGDLANSLEALEEQFENVDLEKTQYFATVNGIPNLYDQQEVPVQQLKQDGGIEGNPNDYTLYAVPTAASDIADREEEFDEPNEKADVDKWDHFLTEKEEGGVV